MRRWGLERKIGIGKIGVRKIGVRVCDSDPYFSYFSLILVAKVAFMSACTTPYEIDVRASPAKPGLYYVIAEGTRFADHNAITHSWHKRAHQLCPNGYDSIVNPQPTNANPQSEKRVTGYVRCQ